MKHHLLVLLASLAMIISGSDVRGTPPTPLYPRSGPISSIYNGSTTRTLQSSPGASQAAAFFTTTNAALDFYSAALTNSLALASTDSSDGTIYVTNIGGAAFTLNASVDFYDYNPVTGSSMIILPGTVASGQLVNAHQTKAIGLPNSSNIGVTGYTVVVGHMLKGTIKLAVSSGGTPSGALLFNTSSGQGFTFVRLPQNRPLIWPFGSFSVMGNTSTAIISSGNPSVAGQTVFFTANVSPVAPASGSPSGTVQFQTNGVNLGAPISVSGGSALSPAIALMATGNYAVSAIYSGNANFCASSGSLAGGQEVSPNQLVDAPPVAGSDSLQTSENATITVTAASLLANDTDPDGDTLSLPSVSATSVQGGTVFLSTGSVSYTPPPSYVGADSFTYTVSDTLGATATGTVNVTVHGTNGTGLAISMLPDLSQQLTCTGAVPGRSYLLQATFDIFAGPWTTLSTNVAGLDGAFLFIDTDAANYPARFYRTATP